MRMLPVCVCALHLHAPDAACRGGVFEEEGRELLPYLVKYHRGEATEEDVRRAEVFLARTRNPALVTTPPRGAPGPRGGA